MCGLRSYRRATLTTVSPIRQGRAIQAEQRRTRGSNPHDTEVPRGLADRPSEPISGYPPFREPSGIGNACHIQMSPPAGIRRVVSATLCGFGLQCHRRATLTYHFPRSTGGDSGKAGGGIACQIQMEPRGIEPRNRLCKRQCQPIGGPVWKAEG